MDLSLSFRAGIVDGRGNDPVGPFTLRGRYDAEKNEVWWTKTYATHDVFYTGFRDSRGIWGTWDIRSIARGGFHIWPQGQGGGAAEEAETAVETPTDAVAGSPAGAPPPPSPGPGFSP
jgi:hypothetical protein